ncbi:exodeoxyribonuclease V subunit beta [Candidatus Blochmannia ocreatus (nom. nud.)]|uniref:RecBCD enzyme subunit RecB n=1 Tax=Candidatus Blochmannia ocreatus (nom. nud.) TaxID=251538 RepID=A0ABY4STN6_9ENTR|nr:exodeoxyribonuclease V subunit beta [Candidatus Blochmannia ocreatus]URJ25334.1 exodeoxyribonuclease V subunit beta [Candidatus Blochmannia ocreatus]
MYRLHVLELPLYGTRLIEASAGTGKTYALIIIYIRLLLCLGSRFDFFRPLTVQEILVVTFTKSSARELRYRIRESIHQFRLDCISGFSTNYIFSSLLKQIKNISAAICILSAAEQEIDQASIFTIHSFCQNILNSHAIELNMLFHTTIVDDEKIFYQQMCEDFWRRNFYGLPCNIVSLVQEYWKDSYSLLNDILPFIYGSYPIFCGYDTHTKRIGISSFYEEIILYIKQLKNAWNINRYEIMIAINSYKINRKIYNKKNLSCWIDRINRWVSCPTVDHIVPKDLYRFSTRALKICNNYKKNALYFLFDSITILYKKLASFKALVFDIAIYEIRNDLNRTRYLRSSITFNDIINVLECNLSDNSVKNNLADIIRGYYPVAIIDEFQDTDEKQFNIFRVLYDNRINNGLILIGDPKQAIYAFRGADVFAYMKARQVIKDKYYFNINWRSSSGMVNAVNSLFQSISNPFIFADMPFIPSKSADNDNAYRFIINNKLQKPMCFWLHPSETITIESYQHAMAEECAIVLYDLLCEINNGNAWLKNKSHKRLLQPSDITILVRTHKEALLMRTALLQANISAVFLSNSKSIFETIESYELLLLLQAVLYLDRFRICTALATIFFNFSAFEIDSVNNDESKWESILENFSEYNSVWKKHGILLMIKKIIFYYKVPEKLLSIIGGESSLINILHLGELLQDASSSLQDEYMLVEWLVSNMSRHTSNEIQDYKLRSGSNRSLIKISTIHKSKGLEFPLVFLPFIADFNYKKNIFFHDRNSYKSCLDFNELESNLVFSDEERLLEDLRLLYVALTRSIYHCSIGIGAITHRYKKKSNINELHRSAVGYLIQKNSYGDFKKIKQNLIELCINSAENISFRIISKMKRSFSALSLTTSGQVLSAKTRKILKNIISWNMTSFSELKKSNNGILCCTTQMLRDINDNFSHEQHNSLSLTPHLFPKGRIFGSFLHNILEVLDIRDAIDIKRLYIYMDKYKIDTMWGALIRAWIYKIVNTSLNYENLTLAKICPNDKRTELQFYLPINKNLNLKKLDALCKKYDVLSYMAPSLNFLEVRGMLNGFIDLVFRWNQQYYLVDYKTNWLGPDNNFYINYNMEQEIIKYRYELQYQLYTLALHRFLRSRLESYKYEKDFGGVYILFIRGMNGKKCSNGVYFSYPKFQFIEKLDNLF